MSESRQKWIEAGYSKFSVGGPDCIHVETLASELGLNKSGFYHYFMSRDYFFEALMDRHSEVNEHFYNEIILSKSFDPDILLLLLKYKKSLHFQIQLRKCNNVPLFAKTFHAVAKKNETAILPKWADMLKIKGNNDLTVQLLNIFRDVIFMRLNSDNFNLEFLQSTTYEFASIVQILKNHGWKPYSAGESIS